MRRRITKYMMLYAIVHILSVSCSKIMVSEIDSQPESQLELNISGSISQVPTKATASGFVDGDVVGLYAVNYSDSNATRGELLSSGNQVDNVSYVFNESVHNWKPTKKAYYKDARTNVDMYVYYPYMASIDDVRHFAFEVEANQNAESQSGGLSPYEKSDLLWGSVVNVTPTDSKVPVTLRHRLSSVVVNLKEGSGFSEGEFASLHKDVVVRNVSRKVEFDFMTGKCLRILSAQDQSVMMKSQNEEDTQFRAIVAPQSVESEVTMFSITLNGIPYSFSRKETTVYESGLQNSYTITINSKGHSGEYELELGEVEISEWREDKLSHGGVARQYYTVNVDEPGTLGAVIKAAQKNPDKIRNLKVTGCLNTDDFYFMRDNMKILEAINLKEIDIVDVDWIIKDVKYYHEYEHREANDNEDEYDGVYKKVIPTNAFYEKSSLHYIVLPDCLEAIGRDAFRGCNISGDMVIPDNVKAIGNNAFFENKITSLTLSQELKYLYNGAFMSCPISGQLYLPQGIRYIGDWALYAQFSGTLVLPDSIEYLGYCPIWGSFSGDLRMPDKITKLGYRFGGYFTGTLILNNVSELCIDAFSGCNFHGNLYLPDAITVIPNGAFYGNRFTSITFSPNITSIGKDAFVINNLMSIVNIPEGVKQIGNSAFAHNGNLQGVDLPSTIEYIGSGAFEYCTAISSIVCRCTEPPFMPSDAFVHVPKDNFSVQVPELSINKYKQAECWRNFRRITGFYDFAINRSMFRTLNAETSREFILRALDGMEWQVVEKPEWVSVEPESGVGKTVVTIKTDYMPVGTTTQRDGTYWPMKGRSGEIVFSLKQKDATTKIAVEQYDYEYDDRDVIEFQKATKGRGVDLILLGDGYDALDIQNNKLISEYQETIEHFFNIEPYATYRDYFNVYGVISKSDDSGVGDDNLVVDNLFGTAISNIVRIKEPDFDKTIDYALNAKTNPSGKSGLDNTLVIMLMNSSQYEGVTYMFEGGFSVACCPVSRDNYPNDFRGLVQHEAGGHGFGHLRDEYIYNNAFISAKDSDEIMNAQSNFGWFRNVSLEKDYNKVFWKHLFFHPNYSDYVDVFEGASFYSRGIFRSEANSCMNNNVPYFSAYSRQLIVEEIMNRAGELFSLEDFYANDKKIDAPVTFNTKSQWNSGVDYRHFYHNPPVIMGKLPERNR